MIALVRGEVAVRRLDHVVVDCGGVGYRLAVSSETLRAVPAAGRSVTLHAHLVVRDDALALYGFASEEERELFLALIGVQGVGPKVALAVLSGGPARELRAALGAGDSARLRVVPGIGPKTAERIVMELRERFGAAVDPRSGTTASAAPPDARGLAREGLVGLGFSPPEAERLLERTQGDTPEELIAAALRGSRA